MKVISPYQIAMGRDPKLSDLLLGDESAASNSSVFHDEGFCHAAERRADAMKSVLDAAHGSAFRRACHARPRPHKAFEKNDQVFPPQGAAE